MRSLLLVAVVTLSVTAASLASADFITGIRNLGIIAGGDGVFCDAFYWTQGNKLCDGKQRCEIPFNEEICSYDGKSYGKLNPNGKNVLHANWLCTDKDGTSTFYSADLQQGLRSSLELFCPFYTIDKDDPKKAEQQPKDLGVHFRPPRPIFNSVSNGSGGEEPKIIDLGVVLGSPGEPGLPDTQGYCDQYFTVAKKCAGKSRCTFEISEKNCNLGKPAINRYTQIHAMYSCGGSTYQRTNVPLSAGNVTLAC